MMPRCQALGSYRQRQNAVPRLGNRLGSTMIVDGMWNHGTGHLPYKRRPRGLRGYGAWRSMERKRQGMSLRGERLIAALEPEQSSWAAKRKETGRIAGWHSGRRNDNAFRGGFRLWRSRAVGNLPLATVPRIARREANVNLNLHSVL